MILQVHDELVFDVPQDEVEQFTHIIRETMEEVLFHGRQYVAPSSLTESRNQHMNPSI